MISGVMMVGGIMCEIFSRVLNGLLWKWIFGLRMMNYCFCVCVMVVFWLVVKFLGLGLLIMIIGNGRFVSKLLKDFGKLIVRIILIFVCFNCVRLVSSKVMCVW